MPRQVEQIGGGIASISSVALTQINHFMIETNRFVGATINSAR